MKDFFKRKYQTKTDSELEQIVDKKADYELSAREAALEILAERKGPIPEIEKSQVKLQEEYTKKINLNKSNFGNGDLDKLGPDGPNLYSETVVYTITLILTPFFGSILMYFNFIELKKPKIANLVLFFGIATLILSFFLDWILQVHYWKLGLIINVIGLVIFSQYFWKIHIGVNFPYYRKPWLLSVIAMVSGFFLLFFLLGFLFILIAG